MNNDLMPTNERANSSFSMRDLMAVAFRHKRTGMLWFFGILLGTVCYVLFAPPRYEATTKFLIDHERMDPVASSDQSSDVMMRTPVSEEEINSEIEVLQSRDVIRQVVMQCGLDKRKLLSEYVFGTLTPEQRTEKMTDRLQSALDVEPGKKSNLIEVSYVSDSAQTSAKVLQALGDVYVKHHMMVHTPPGQSAFFDQETDRYAKNLANASDALKKFSTEQDGVAPSVARDLFLEKLSEFHLDLQTTRSELAATEERVKTLEKQAGATPQRLTTELKESDDAQVLQGLKNTLMEVELKRTELLTKYQPDYPLVVEADKEIADTKAAIAAEEAKPIKEATTDRNPTYAWVDEELAKAKADYSGYKAQEAAMQAIVAMYEAKARDLEQKGLIEQDLLRNYKAEEESYLLYLKKREEARMSEAMDSTRIANVSVAETPIVPHLPSHSAAFYLLLGTLAAGMLSVGAVFVQEYLDPSFRTPTEMAAELNIPVLAAVPSKLQPYPGVRASGNGNGNGHGRYNGNGNGHGNGNGNGNGHSRGQDYSPGDTATSVSPASQVGNR